MRSSTVEQTNEKETKEKKSGKKQPEKKIKETKYSRAWQSTVVIESFRVRYFPSACSSHHMICSGRLVAMCKEARSRSRSPSNSIISSNSFSFS